MTDTEYAQRGSGRKVPLAAALLTAVTLLNGIGFVSEGHAVMAEAVAAEKNTPAMPNSTVPPARDPEISVKEEYDAALRQGTMAALNLFLARHPDGPFAEKARADLRRLSR